MTVVLQGYISVPPNEIKTLRYKLQAHIEQTLDEEAFNAHQARIKVSEWDAVSKNVTRFYRKRWEA